MTAPTRERGHDTVELRIQPPQAPLPIRIAQFIWKSGLIVFPITPLAAVGVGALLREVVLTVEDQRFQLTVAVLLIVLVASGFVFLLAPRANSEDTGATSIGRED